MKTPFVYVKTEPTEYARFTRAGKSLKEGNGASGWILPYKTTVERVSTSNQQLPIQTKLLTADRQEVAVNGVIGFSIKEPAKFLNQYAMTIDPRTGMNESNDFDLYTTRLRAKLTNAARLYATDKKFEGVLNDSEALSNYLNTQAVGYDSGLIEFSGVTITGITGDPDLMRSLGAPMREQVMQAENEAGYDRREAGLERERGVKLLDVETKMQVEQAKTALLELEAANATATATYEAEAIKIQMAGYESLSDARLQALGLLELGRGGSLETLVIGGNNTDALLGGVGGRTN